MRQSLDLFSEKRLTDNGLDKQASAALDREYDDIAMDGRDCQKERFESKSSGLSMKDKTSIASVSILLGSHFLLFALAAINTFDSRKNKMLTAEQENSLRGIAMARMLKGKENQALNSSDKITKISIKTEQDIKPNDKPIKKKRRKKGSLEQSDNSSNQVVFSDHKDNMSKLFPKNGKFSWLEASKLIQRREFLKTHIERLNGKADYHHIVKLTSEMELLDKALKKMGC